VFWFWASSSVLSAAGRGGGHHYYKSLFSCTGDSLRRGFNSLMIPHGLPLSAWEAGPDGFDMQPGCYYVCGSLQPADYCRFYRLDQMHVQANALDLRPERQRPA